MEQSDAFYDWIDLERLARSGQPLRGVQPIERLQRVWAEAPQLDAQGHPGVAWQVRAQWREASSPVAAALRLLGGAAATRQLWLHLRVQGAVPLVCQRCLEPFWQPLEVDRWFRFVADEAAAWAEDERCEEDLLVANGPRFDLRSLIEDELLLAAPLAPMHERCPRPLPLSAGDRLGLADAESNV
ncbi:putative ACR [Tepidimonas alkaliphilus]|uniref:Large ribosomal RNA subunit accumulation protein YceD n=2 Tax=Tepidimonas alkaliphilus TaxID=2588942 RepID=A0A554W561_9BURK|nr:putative ACR [Tepidimonas alkaliphilus]